MAAFLADFHWLRPLWLSALIPAVLLLVLLWRSHFQSQQWHKHIAPALLPTLLQGGTSKASRFLLVAIALAWLAATIAMAGPVWQKQPTPVVQNTEALVICWDLSPSMLAEDITPSRLARSRLKIIDLLKARPDGQTALIAYSAEAYTVTPLTDDIQTVINLLPALAPTTLPSVGSNPEMAFEQANELLKQAGINHGHIVMLTDEITDDAMEAMRDSIQASPHQLTLWGIGSTQGAPIPLPQGGFARNSQGAIAVAKLNEAELQTFASQTNSYYVPVVTDGSDISTLKTLLSDNPNNDNTQKSNRSLDQWVEHGHWLIALCLPLLALGFRRGWLLAALIAMPSLLVAPQSQAQFLNNAFKTPNQRGQDAYQQKAYEEAAKAFEQPAWQGAALYRQGNYAEAAKAFSQDTSANGAYNQGNAELLQSNIDGAIKAYEEALQKQPDHPGAQKNLALAKAIKKQQDEQKDQNKDSQEQDKNDQQDQDQQDQDQDQDQDQQQQQDSKKQQNAKDQEQQNGQQSSASNQDQQQATQQSAGASASSQAAGTANSSENSNHSSAAAAMAGSSSAASDNNEAAAMTQAGAQEPQTEEEQMLEQILRKVPDDPSGLLREKFRYQYRERQQKLNSGGTFDQSERAEQRW